MRRSVFSLLFIALVLIGYSCKPKANAPEAGTLTSKEIPVSEYNYISSTLPIDIVYEQKEGAPYLKLDVDQSILDKLEVNVKDSILHLTFASGTSFNNIAKSTVYTNSRALKLVAIAGSGDFHLKGTVTGKRLDLRMDGSGDFQADDIRSTSLAVTLSGSGDAELKGEVEAASYNIAGSGSVKADQLGTQNLRVFLTGSGDAEVKTKDYLYVVLKGSGDVSYKEEPTKVESKITGSGTVKKD